MTPDARHLTLVIVLIVAAASKVAALDFARIDLPELTIDGRVARAHTQGLWVDRNAQQPTFFVTARRDDLSPRRALLLRTQAHDKGLRSFAPWHIWDITPAQTGGSGRRRGLDHPGGIDADGRRLWVPVSESRRDGKTFVRAYEIAALKSGVAAEPTVEFLVDDHIGAVAVAPERNELYGASWDTARVFVWDLKGHEKRRISPSDLLRARIGVLAGRPEYGLAVQDWKWHAGRLLASGLVKAGKPRSAADVNRRLPPPRSRLVVLDPADFTVAQEWQLPRQRGAELSREGMAMATNGDAIYFLPGDLGSKSENRAYRVSLSALTSNARGLAALPPAGELPVVDALGDLWANPTGTQLTYVAAQPVFEFLGASRKIGIAMRRGGHDQTHADWTTLLEFMELQFFEKPPQSGRRFDALPFPKLPKRFGWSTPQVHAEHPGRRPRVVKHVTVYKAPGRFGGWPANHGIWSWDDEILVGFGVGHHKDLGPRRHAIDREKPEEHWLARSRDGGETWTLDHPGERGFLVPFGDALHGSVPPYLKQQKPVDCPGGIPFKSPGFAMTLRMENHHRGPSRLHYSVDRGVTWKGPFRFPNLGTPGIAARTDYLVDGPNTCTVFLTAAKANGREGRPVCARTSDGGKTWKPVSYIGPEPKGFAIMPSAVRLSNQQLVTALRCRHDRRRWIETWKSRDNGKTWSFLGRPVESAGEGNPPALIRLRDGRLVLTYGYRAPPFGIRARVSRDGGESWGPIIILRTDGGGRDVGYPRSVERTDGKIVTVYYIHDAPKSERYIAATIWEG